MNVKKFIVVEGLEGAGKSTVIEAIKTFFSQLPSSPKIVFTREPGGTFLAEKIRSLLIEKFQQETLCSESELLLMYASRMQHVNRLIKPALEKDCWVVSDRFNWSSMAYQGGGRDLTLEQVQKLDVLMLSDCQPGLVIYMDIDPELGLSRIQGRDEIDRFEQEKVTFFQRARSVYKNLCKQYDYAVEIDASQSPEAVREAVLAILKKHITTL